MQLISEIFSGHDKTTFAASITMRGPGCWLLSANQCQKLHRFESKIMRLSICATTFSISIKLLKCEMPRSIKNNGQSKDQVPTHTQQWHVDFGASRLLRRKTQVLVFCCLFASAAGRFLHKKIRFFHRFSSSSTRSFIRQPGYFSLDTGLCGVHTHHAYTHARTHPHTHTHIRSSPGIRCVLHNETYKIIIQHASV